MARIVTIEKFAETEGITVQQAKSIAKANKRIKVKIKGFRSVYINIDIYEKIKQTA